MQETDYRANFFLSDNRVSHFAQRGSNTHLLQCSHYHEAMANGPSKLPGVAVRLSHAALPFFFHFDWYLQLLLRRRKRAPRCLPC